jgi:hypothetical protein
VVRFSPDVRCLRETSRVVAEHRPGPAQVFKDGSQPAQCVRQRAGTPIPPPVGCASRARLGALEKSRSRKTKVTRRPETKGTDGSCQLPVKVERPTQAKPACVRQLAIGLERDALGLKALAEECRPRGARISISNPTPAADSASTISVRSDFQLPTFLLGAGNRLLS